MATTSRDTLLERFQRGKKADGLLDQKFCLGKVSESTVEDVCADANRFYDEMAKGNAKVVKSWGDSNRPKK